MELSLNENQVRKLKTLLVFITLVILICLIILRCI